VTINSAPIVYSDFGAPVYRTEIAGLTADTVYSYNLAIQETGGTGTAGYTGGTFRTAPTAARSFSFAVWADSGYKYDDYATKSGWPSVSAAMANNAAVELVAAAGDLAGWNSPTNGDTEWETRFALPARNLLAHKPMLFAQGNHDNHSGSSPTADPYAVALFNMKAPANNQWYSTWVYGSARFIVLDTESYTVGGAQHTWFSQTLSAATEPYVFVMQHIAPFSSSHQCVVDANGVPYGYYTRNFLQGAVPLMEQYHVSADFMGHDHLYERSLKNGVVYVIDGCGGDGLDVESNQDYSGHTSGSIRRIPIASSSICPEYTPTRWWQSPPPRPQSRA